MDFKRRQTSMELCTTSHRPMAGARLRDTLCREDHEVHLGGMLHAYDHTCGSFAALNGQQSMHILAVHTIPARWYATEDIRGL